MLMLRSIVHALLEDAQLETEADVANPWAACTASIAKTAGTTKRSEWSDSDNDRYEDCVMAIKRGKRKKRHRSRTR